jgi:hypothetical protein
MNVRLLAQPALLALAAGLLASSLAPNVAFAQGIATQLASSVVQAPTISESDEKAIRDFTAPLIAALKQSAEQTKNSRDALLAPLARGAAPSNAFRLRYASIIAPALTDLLRSGNELQQVNALVLAGELATSDGVRVLSSASASKTASVRYQAAAGAKRTLVILGSLASPTLDRTAASALLKDLSTQLAKDTDAVVIDELLSALSQGLDIESVREDAIRELSTSIAHLTTAAGKKPADPAIAQGLLRTADKLRDVATRSRNLSADFHKASSQAGGALVAHAARLAKAKALPQGSDDETRKLVSQLAGTAETLLLTAGQNMQRSLTQANLSQALSKGTSAGDAEFADSAKRLLDAVKLPPFSVPAAVIAID